MTAPPDRYTNEGDMFQSPGGAWVRYDDHTAAIAAAEARGGAGAWKAVAALLRSGAPPEMVAAIAEQAVVSLTPAPPADGGDT